MIEILIIALITPWNKKSKVSIINKRCDITDPHKKIQSNIVNQARLLCTGTKFNRHLIYIEMKIKAQVSKNASIPTVLLKNKFEGFDV